MTRPFVKEQKDKIVKLAVDHGLNAQLIAERLGCGRVSVARRLHDWGYEWDRSQQRWVPRPS